MGIFADYARTYWELGYSIIPIRKGEKRPFLDYSLYRDQACSEETLDDWISQYPDGNIAIVPGPASGLAMLDLDIKNEPDLLNKALKLCPRSPVERFGSKGLGIIVRYNGQAGRKLYFKGKEIGEMIVNTVFVIPPSIHPDTGKEYTWTGYTSLESELKEDMLSELPCPTDEEINQFEYALEHSDVEVDKDYFKQVTGRNNKLKAICGSMISRGLLPEQMAPLLLAEDLALNSENSLFSDPAEFKGRGMTPLGNAYIFSSNIFKTYFKQACQRGEEIPQFSRKATKEVAENVDYTRYKLFFEKVLKNCKRDIIDGVLKAKDDRKFWQPVGNSIKALKSYGTDAKLSVAKFDVHFARFERESKKQLLCEKVPWDGKDHIAEMVKCVRSSNMTSEETVHLFKQWMALAVGRIETGEQNTMILLQGGQGVGKDVFVKNLCSGFSPYYSNFTDASQEKDMFMQVSKNLIVNVSEFDKLNKKHPGMIKDLISRETAQFRPSHMQHFEDFAMNASFIGSVNTKDFLTDHTGNRRFWVFEDVEIDWSYTKGLGAQVLAQAKDLCQRGYKAPKETLAKMSASVNALGPDDQDTAVTMIWNEAFDKVLLHMGSTTREYLKYAEVEDAMYAVQRFCGMRSLRKVQQTLKRLGAQHRTSTARYYKKIFVNAGFAKEGVEKKSTVVTH